MFTRNLFFRFYTSSTPGEVPTLLQNYFGRVWLNTADGILYSTKYVDNVLTLVATPLKALSGTPVNAIAAQGTFEITGVNPILVAGKLLRIDNKPYGIVAALSGIEVEGEVLIGANDAATIDNLVLAIAGDAGTHGVNHWCTEHPTVEVYSHDATTLIVVAKVAGAAGNLIPITTTIAAGAAWDGPTLGTTVLGVNGTTGTLGESYISADLRKTWVCTATDTGNGATWELAKFSRITKRYSCFIAQDGVAAPIPTVLEDELGGPVWSRVGVGDYLLTKANAFTQDKTKPFKAVAINIDGHKLEAQWLSANAISFKTYDAVDITTLADDVFALDEINIEVYD